MIAFLKLTGCAECTGRCVFCVLLRSHEKNYRLPISRVRADSSAPDSQVCDAVHSTRPRGALISNTTAGVLF